ncbi:MAG TPA: DNA methyltransferase [Chthonomonadaceae bacterium]|nr:DNA methyltransferase [Chthonomonadaceae bacterium]
MRPGDLWQLGQHRLLCADSTDPNQIAFLMQGERAALAITSPPYNLGASATLSVALDLGASRYVGQRDARPAQDWLELLRRSTGNALAVSEVVVVNLQLLANNKVALLEYLHMFRHSLADVAVWDKGSAPPAMARNVMGSQFEFLLFLTARKSKGRTPRSIPTADFRGTVANVYRGPGRRQNPYFRLHAATFPLHLPLWLMETFDVSKGTIFDPFLGTGTTLMAAERTGRRCYGMEIEPVYCGIAISRWEQMTGEPARRL